MAVIPPLWKVEAGGSRNPAQPGQFSKIMSQKIRTEIQQRVKVLGSGPVLRKSLQDTW